MYFKVPRLIADLSAGTTLEAGDVISTGTPEGVGFARTPAEFLRPGDLLETEIEGIGVMRNPIGWCARGPATVELAEGDDRHGDQGPGRAGRDGANADGPV